MDVLVFILIAAILAAIYYLLYINGILAINSKRAVRFVGKDHGNSASFSSCDETIKRVVKFPESRQYTFVLNSELSKGQMNVELFDFEKKHMFRLTQGDSKKTADIQKGKRYYLVFNFKYASGKFDFHYE